MQLFVRITSPKKMWKYLIHGGKTLHIGILENNFKSKDGKTEGQTVSTSPKNFDGQTTTNVKKDIDAYFNAVLLGGESKNYNKFVSTDLGKAKSELSQYFSDSLQYSYD